MTASATIAATPTETTWDHARQREQALRELAKRSFCTLATVSGEHRPHVVGVRYALVGGALYVTMFDDSIKVRNMRENPRVAVCVPGRKIPFYPPFAVQFQGRAELLSRDHPRIVELFEAGRLKGIISKKDFELPQTIFARITPARRLSTYGIGVPLLQIAKDPTSAIRSVTL